MFYTFVRVDRQATKNPLRQAPPAFYSYFPFAVSKNFAQYKAIIWPQVNGVYY